VVRPQRCRRRTLCPRHDDDVALAAPRSHRFRFGVPATQHHGAKFHDMHAGVARRPVTTLADNQTCRVAQQTVTATTTGPTTARQPQRIAANKKKRKKHRQQKAREGEQRRRDCRGCSAAMHPQRRPPTAQRASEGAAAPAHHRTLTVTFLTRYLKKRDRCHSSSNARVRGEFKRPTHTQRHAIESPAQQQQSR
jgi:hypothetical protein